MKQQFLLLFFYMLCFRKFEKRFYSLLQEVMKDVTRLTGCLAPCHYTEFRIISEANKVVSIIH